MVTLLRICCEMCQSVALSKPYFCLFLNKNNFTLSILASDLGFQRLVFCCGPESNCPEGCLGRRIILMYNPLFSVNYYHVFLDKYLLLNIPKYEIRILVGLFREWILGCRLWYLLVFYSEVPEFPLAALPSCFWFMLEDLRLVIGHCCSKWLATFKNLTVCTKYSYLLLWQTNHRAVQQPQHKLNPNTYLTQNFELCNHVIYHGQLISASTRYLIVRLHIL